MRFQLSVLRYRLMGNREQNSILRTTDHGKQTAAEQTSNAQRRTRNVQFGLGTIDYGTTDHGLPEEERVEKPGVMEWWTGVQDSGFKEGRHVSRDS